MGKSVEDLLQELVDNQKQSNRRSPSASTDGGFAGLGIIGDAAKTGAGAMNELWRGTLNVSNGFNQLTGLIQRHGGELGRVLGDVAQKVGSAVIDTTTSLNKAGQYGADMGMDIAEYDRLLKGARMTHEQYNDFIKQSAVDLNGLGGGINKAQKNFLDIAKSFQESDIGAKFKELGWSTDELNELTKTSLSGRKGADLSDPAKQAAALIATEKLAMSMDENTRILGISRKEQMDELNRAKEDARLEATLQSMDPEARARYNQALSENAGQGEAFKRALKEAFTGKITAEGSEALASLGTAAADVTKYGIALRDSSVEGQKQAQALGEQARASATEWRGSEGFRNMVRYSDGGVAEMASRELTTAKSQAVVATKQAEDERAGKPTDEKGAIKELSTAAHYRSMGLKEDGTPLDSAGANVATTLNKVDRTLTDMFAGSSDAFSRLVGSADDLATSINKANTELLKPHTQEQTNILGMAERAGEHILKNTPLLKESKEASDKNTLNPADVIKAPVQRANGSPELDKFLSSTSSSFSSMFESFDPKGTPAELHGNELVATPAQMEKLISRFVPEDMINMFNSPANLPKTDTGDVKPPVINIPSPTNITDATKTPDIKQPTQVFSPKFEEDLIKTVNGTIEKVFGKAFQPIENIAKAAPKAEAPKPVEVKHETPKPVEIKPVEVKKEEPKPVEVKKEEPKPAEVKKEEPKLPTLGIKSADDLNHFLYGTTTVAKPAEKVETKLPNEDNLLKGFDFKTNLKTPTADDLKIDEILAKMAPTPIEMPSSMKDEMAKFADSLKSSDFQETFKDLSTNLTDSFTTSFKTGDLSEMMSSLGDTLESTDFNDAFESISESFSPLMSNMADLLPTSIEDLSKENKELTTEDIDTSDQSSRLKEQLDSAIENFNSTKFEMFDEDEDLIKGRQDEFAKEQNKPSLFDSIANMFNSNEKPAFASGNVKYETIPQEEIDAKNKRMQESIGKIDNSPEAIAAQKAELDRQKNSGLYRQKEPEKAPTVDIKKTTESKEDAHITEMYKKFGFESFKDFNTRLDAEEKAKRVETAKVAEAKHPEMPAIKNIDMKPPTLTADSVKQPAPAPQPKPAEEHKPAEPPKVTAQVVEKQVSLKDILDAVTTLNKTMAEMVHHTDKISSISQKQLGAIQNSSNSRF